MGLISRVSSRTYRLISSSLKKYFQKMSLNRKPRRPNDPHYLEKTENDLAKLIISKENFENSISLETSFNNEPIKIGSKLSSRYAFTSYTKPNQQMFLKFIYGKSY